MSGRLADPPQRRIRGQKSVPSSVPSAQNSPAVISLDLVDARNVAGESWCI